MSSRRAPSAPPEIPGYTFRKVVGTGGFSDVFLYDQQRPRRQVAVKVLLKEWSQDSQRAAFEAEADLMATLGNHPSIVTMYGAGVAPDGRPYLALEYCSRPNLGARYRAERMSVAEAMRTTIQVAGAIETAHRLGILHRDVKPANILVTQFGHPALTDFGISSSMDSADVAEGMSIPWSPPESFGDPPVSGIATDVWALGATCYSLLAGRTPFEVPGGSNSSADLMGRIATAPLTPIGRGDVPESLERVLRIAMAKRPESRYPSALAFARAIQQVQVELARDMTPIDLLDETGVVQDDDDEADGTRMSRITAIDPDQGGGPAPVMDVPFAGVPAPASPPQPAATPPAAVPAFAGTAGTAGPVVTASPAGQAGQAGQAGSVGPGYVPVVSQGDQGAEPLVDETIARPEHVEGAPEQGPEPESRSASRWAWALIAVGCILVLGVGSLIWFVNRSAGEGDPDAGSATPQSAAPADPVVGYVPPVQDLTAKVDGDELVVTWDAPREHEDGDQYGYRRLSLTSEEQYQRTDKKTASVPWEKKETCVEVVVIRGSKVSAQVEQACVGPDGKAE